MDEVERWRLLIAERECDTFTVDVIVLAHCCDDAERPLTARKLMHNITANQTKDGRRVGVRARRGSAREAVRV